MPALPIEDISASSEILHSVVKRGNWASKNPGPILVFCIVFIVGMGIALLVVYRFIMAKKAARQAYEVE
ncbi:uncharacterized protein ASPGLDRAFT_50242 [Aspergillus glaucus CBS 516.65]|uniref:Uncharacterized protein n=1 Tax=Aspergillus glaucus CBS 516.65 TaxID=1160497 RepID=A0A1L9VCQ1_ASPGL|nr:hypothetical protein ASPGLDRAFT_50242 [Aspergillus glaucus CBS 516.65]OJJ81694.1 hypothetical protein ASPGLDRAFT_50242 [Aspergillus glaucus CBS 516.65]